MCFYSVKFCFFFVYEKVLMHALSKVNPPCVNLYTHTGYNVECIMHVKYLLRGYS